MTQLALILSLTSVVAFGGSIYSVTVVSLPGGFTNINLSGVNNSGQVAGYGSNGSYDQAFIASPSGSVTVPLAAGWNYAYASGISNSGELVGTVYVSAGNSQVFVGTASGSMTIPLPGGGTSSGEAAISSSGLVAGAVTPDGSTSQPFVGSTSASTLIPDPVGWSIVNTTGVSDSGQVVGTLWNFGPGTSDQAFIGTTSESVAIPIPSGWSESFGDAINASGEVAGTVSNGVVDQAFIDTGSGISLIPLPSGATSALVVAESIDDLGVVVGGSNAGAWIWDSTDGTVLLNSLLGSSGWSVDTVYAISSNGLILASATCNAGAPEVVELSNSPGGDSSCSLAATPEPGTFMLAGLGLILTPAREEGSIKNRPRADRARSYFSSAFTTKQVVFFPFSDQHQTRNLGRDMDCVPRSRMFFSPPLIEVRRVSPGA